MLDILWKILVSFIFFSCFFTTIRTSFSRFFPELESKNKYWIMISHENWLILVLVLVVMKIGEYGRGETSYVPWEVYESVKYRTQDEYDSLIESLWVLMTDIVILFGCSEYLIKEKMKEIQKQDLEVVRDHLKSKLEERKKFYYLLNFVMGLLLMTEHNLLYKLLESLPKVDDTPE
jgi:cytochrome bd-type quinol oxidase subunit 1